MRVFMFIMLEVVTTVHFRLRNIVSLLLGLQNDTLIN